MHHIITPTADLKLIPNSSSETQTQILYGEQIDVLEKNGDFALVSVVQKNDSYKGYILKESFAKTYLSMTHRVMNASTLLFNAPDIKTPNPEHISVGSCVCVVDESSDKFYKTHTNQYIFKNHVMPINNFLDFSPTAWIEFLHKNFYHTPYLWGGRSSFGIDCSGLVQVSLQAFGIFLPRDSKPQENFCLKNGDLHNPQTGDLIFWAGHVGIMANNTDLIHANAYHLKVGTEKLSDVINRNPNPVAAVKKIEFF
jgi:hypothetical protein